MVNLLDEFDPRDRRVRDQRSPVPADQRARAGAWWPSTATPYRAHWIAREDRYAEKLATPDTSVADLIGDVDPIQVAEGRYLARRADDPLRHDPAHEPRHRRDQRVPRPPRADPGIAVQHPGGARRPDPRLPDPAAARPAAGRDREPRRLHAPRPHRVAAEGPVRNAGAHALPRDAGRGDPRSWIRRLGPRRATSRSVSPRS